MAPQTEFLDVLLNTVEANCSLGTEISLKELGANEGIYVELGQGSTDTVYYNKQMIKVIPAMFMSRHKSQKQCMDWKYIPMVKHSPGWIQLLLRNLVKQAGTKTEHTVIPAF